MTIGQRVFRPGVRAGRLEPQRDAGGTTVTIAEPPALQPENGRAVFFVVEADCPQLAELAQRLRDRRLTSNVGAVRQWAEAPAAFGPDAPPVSLRR